MVPDIIPGWWQLFHLPRYFCHTARIKNQCPASDWTSSPSRLTPRECHFERREKCARESDIRRTSLSNKEQKFESEKKNPQIVLDLILICFWQEDNNILQLLYSWKSMYIFRYQYIIIQGWLHFIMEPRFMNNIQEHIIFRARNNWRNLSLH